MDNENLTSLNSPYEDCRVADSAPAIGAHRGWPPRGLADLAVLPAPRHLQDMCVAERAGIAGCRACADVCPHDALRFTAAGPQIDADACRRCGACTAACPVGALDRSYLPDAELLGLVATAAATRPALLVLTCNHDASAGREVADGRVRLALPCIQLVSDDLLVFAVTHGAHAVRVEPGPACPHGPHVQPSRAVEAARAVLESRGWDGSRVEMTGSGRAVDPPHARGPELLSVMEPHGLRYERRMALLGALGTGTQSRGAPIAAGAVPWRRAVVDQRACTACGACAFVCPTGALVLGEGGTALYGREAACIGCELCSRACPEDALALLPTVPAANEPRLLARPDMASCHNCGQPLLPEPLIRKIEEKLARTDAVRRAAVRLCEHCKGAHLFEPACAAGPAPATTGGAAPHRAVSPPAGVGAPAQPSVESDVSRRSFLQMASTAALGAVALAGCAAAVEAEESKHRYGMVIDTRRCVGCNACVIACKAENKTPPGVNYMLVTNNTLGERPDDKPLFTAKPCFHCEKPPCVDVCPVSATFKRKQDGIVVVDYDRCIGCRYCQTACPYGARFFDFGENYAAETGAGAYRPPSPEYNQFRPRTDAASPIGNVRKCTFCMHLQDEKGEYDKNAGRWPACAKSCPSHAIHFGDFKNPDGDLSRLVRERQPVRIKDELGAEPNVVYLL